MDFIYFRSSHAKVKQFTSTDLLMHYFFSATHILKLPRTQIEAKNASMANSASKSYFGKFYNFKSKIVMFIISKL